MALDIRLDYINGINPTYVEMMTTIRGMFDAIDTSLKVLADEAASNPAAARAIAIARTNNEAASMYAIKTLCILGEVK